MIMEFLGNQKSKTPYVVVEKNSFAFSDRDFFSVLRVWLLFTVNMDHPVLRNNSFQFEKNIFKLLKQNYLWTNMS